jgi:hypothetical protein
MTAAASGSVRIDMATGHLLVDGVPSCLGCAKPSTTRFCGHICEVKRSNEQQYLRTHLLPIRVWRALIEAGAR